MRRQQVRRQGPVDALHLVSSQRVVKDVNHPNSSGTAPGVDPRGRGTPEAGVRFLPTWLERLLRPSISHPRGMEAPVTVPLHGRPSSARVRNALDIPGAIAAHLAWKRRLEDFLASDCRDVLDPLHVCRDDQCSLGRWIHGLGAQRYAGNPGFQRLRATHADFHFAAARVVALAQGRRDAQAREEILRGEFAKTSIRIQSELAKLYVAPHGATGGFETTGAEP